MKKTISYERIWRPVFVFNDPLDMYNPVVEIDDTQFEEYRSLADEFIEMGNKLEMMFKQMIV